MCKYLQEHKITLSHIKHCGGGYLVWEARTDDCHGSGFTPEEAVKSLFEYLGRRSEHAQ